MTDPIMTDAMSMAREYASRVRAQLGAHVHQIVLFGSRARGDAREDSDFDLLVIVDKATPEVRRATLDTSVAMMDRYNRIFSTLLYDETRWSAARRFPLGFHIERDGIAL